MNRFESYFGIIIALFFGVFIATFFGDQISLPAPIVATYTASSTLSVESDSSSPAPSPSLVLPKESIVATSSAEATSTPHKKITTSAPVAVAAVVPKSTSVPSPAPVSAAELDASAALLRAALVNILCYVPQGTILHSISGSGVFIDPKGIILTNAHIAQYFLLADRDVTCVIRSGSPARNNYSAALMYIPPAWIKENANVLTEETPSGTGQYDFALLAVTKSATSSALPAAFPSLPLAQQPPVPGTPIVIASYGAQFLESSQIQSSLFPTVVFGSVKDVFTYVKNTIDVIALGGSAAAQEGSSGGGVAGASGTLLGTITTSTIKGDTSTRSLSAITASYIRGEYASETGEAIDILLAASTSASVANFAPRIPSLEKILASQLP